MTIRSLAGACVLAALAACGTRADSPQLPSAATLPLSPSVVETELGSGTNANASFVAVYGNTLAVGKVSASATIDGGSQVASGGIDIWELSDAGWTQTQKLSPPSPVANERFGNAVALDGQHLVTCAPNYTARTNTTGQPNGAIFFFAYDAGAGGWYYQHSIVGSDGAWLCNSLSIDGTSVAAGSGFSSSSHFTEDGEADVYVLSNGTWSLQKQLYPSDTTTQQAAYFGAGVALSGNTLVVGAPGHDFSGLTNVGAIYVYSRSGTTWSQVQELEDPADGGNDRFGFSLATDGTAVAAGAWGSSAYSAGAGAVYVYPLANGQLGSTPQLIGPSDPTSSGRFGAALAFGGGSLGVGSYMPYTQVSSSRSGAGTAYVFQLDGGQWSQVVELADDGGTPIGSTVAVGQDWLATGNDVAGTPPADAYYFTWSDGISASSASSSSGSSSTTGSGSSSSTGATSTTSTAGSSSSGATSTTSAGSTTGGATSTTSTASSTSTGATSTTGGTTTGSALCGGGCQQGFVCCTVSPCSGQCVPDCRIAGSCPNSLTCDTNTGVCVPAGSSATTSTSGGSTSTTSSSSSTGSTTTGTSSTSTTATSASSASSAGSSSTGSTGSTGSSASSGSSASMTGATGSTASAGSTGSSGSSASTGSHGSSASSGTGSTSSTGATSSTTGTTASSASSGSGTTGPSTAGSSGSSTTGASSASGTSSGGAAAGATAGGSTGATRNAGAGGCGCTATGSAFDLAWLGILGLLGVKRRGGHAALRSASRRAE